MDSGRFDRLARRLAGRRAQSSAITAGLRAGAEAGQVPDPPSATGMCPYEYVGAQPIGHPPGPTPGTCESQRSPAQPRGGARVVGQRESSASSGPPGQLSRREREVATLIVQGLHNREIAAVLVVSERTVHAHVRNLLGKLGFASRTQVAAWGIERSLHQQAAPSSVVPGNRQPQSPRLGIS